MATEINVIVAKNKVYATYVKTICFVGEFNGDDEHDDMLITKAQSIAFSYGQSKTFKYAWNFFYGSLIKL